MPVDERSARARSASCDRADHRSKSRRPRQESAQADQAVRRCGEGHNPIDAFRPDAAASAARPRFSSTRRLARPRQLLAREIPRPEIPTFSTSSPTVRPNNRAVASLSRGPTRARRTAQPTSAHRESPADRKEVLRAGRSPTSMRRTPTCRISLVRCSCIMPTSSPLSMKRAWSPQTTSPSERSGQPCNGGHPDIGMTPTIPSSGLCRVVKSWLSPARPSDDFRRHRFPVSF